MLLHGSDFNEHVILLALEILAPQSDCFPRLQPSTPPPHSCLDTVVNFTVLFMTRNDIPHWVCLFGTAFRRMVGAHTVITYHLVNCTSAETILA